MFGTTRFSLHSHDWEKHKSEIAARYAHEQLRDLMQYMATTHDFHATEKQWKNQLRRWDLTKRTRRSDYRAILRKKRQRESERPGVETEFFLHGEKVPQGKIERWERDNRGKVTDWDGAETPPYLSCSTPPLRPQSVPSPSSGCSLEMPELPIEEPWSLESGFVQVTSGAAGSQTGYAQVHPSVYPEHGSGSSTAHAWTEPSSGATTDAFANITTSPSISFPYSDRG